MARSTLESKNMNLRIEKTALSLLLVRFRYFMKCMRLTHRTPLENLSLFCVKHHRYVTQWSTRRRKPPSHLQFHWPHFTLPFTSLTDNLPINKAVSVVWNMTCWCECPKMYSKWKWIVNIFIMWFLKQVPQSVWRVLCANSVTIF